MNPESTALQAEIQRLNVIISVLVEKNQQLEQEIALLTGKAPVENPKSILPENLKSNLEGKSILPENFKSHLEARNILADKSAMPVTAANILPESLDRMDAGGDRMEKNSDRMVSDENNLTKSLDGMVVAGDRQEKNLDRMVVAGDRMEENLDGMLLEKNALPHNLDKIELLKLGMSTDVDRLYTLLKKEEMLQVGNEGVRNVAKALKVLAEVENPTFRHIRKQTGQSESGINKMMASMRKRNLVVRTKQHVYHLTEKGVRLLGESGGGMS